LKESEEAADITGICKQNVFQTMMDSSSRGYELSKRKCITVMEPSKWPIGWRRMKEGQSTTNG